MELNYHKIDKCSISNGIGIQVVLWISGCEHHCKGCQNPETWEYESGKLFDDKAQEKLFDYLSLPYVSGITLSGGDPLADKNLRDVYNLITDIKNKCSDKKIWLYTGYTLHDSDFNTISGLNLNAEEDYYWFRIIHNCDVIVDGEYIDELRDLTLAFRGSSNQRLIDVKKSIENKSVVLWGDTNE